MRARLLRSDDGKTVARSHGDGGTGPLWSLWDYGLLGVSLVPPDFYRRALLVICLPLYFHCVHVYVVIVAIVVVSIYWGNDNDDVKMFG